MKSNRYESGPRRINAYLLVLFTGFLIILSFPKFGHGIFAWVALVPFLFAIKDTHPLKAMGLGFLAGILGFTGMLYWIAYVVVTYGYLPLYVGIPVMLLLAAYMSLYLALFAGGIRYLSARKIPLVLSAPALWTVLEYIRSHLFTGFPWENIGYSQYRFEMLRQAADIFGVFGISFIIVLINVMVYDLLAKKNAKKILIAEAALGICLIVVLNLYGYLRTEEIKRIIPNAEKLNVMLVQGNIEQDIKWNPAYQVATVSKYCQLTLADPPTRETLVVWPETAAPFYFQDENFLHHAIAGAAKLTGSWLLLGSPAYDKIGADRYDFSNSAFLLSPSGIIAGRYDKVHLVPYGEYVPLRRFFPFIGRLVAGVGDFKEGRGFYPLTMGNHKLGLMICYEGILPEAGRAYKRRGTDLLVNITNDAWFGKTSAPYQHVSMTVFRAIENRLYVVRAANTGITGVIDPLGNIAGATSLFQDASVKGTVAFLRIPTIYEKYGDLFVPLCVILLIVIFISSRKGTKAND
ncbi:MAG: apolipoprotein N-acyltransferase [Smithellaceae bacterium]|nr:apolipoprotein N-acyltransferase [Smithellaceae bacterium]